MQNNLLEKCMQNIIENKRKYLGFIIGLFIGILFISFGFFKTIIIGIMAFLGYYLIGCTDFFDTLSEKFKNYLNR